MSSYTFEEPIGFHLTKIKGAVKTGADAYRAVLAHNGLTTRATLDIMGTGFLKVVPATWTATVL